MLLTIYVIKQKTMSPRKSEEDFMNKFCKSQEEVSPVILIYLESITDANKAQIPNKVGLFEGSYF